MDVDFSTTRSTKVRRNHKLILKEWSLLRNIIHLQISLGVCHIVYGDIGKAVFQCPKESLESGGRVECFGSRMDMKFSLDVVCGLRFSGMWWGGRIFGERIRLNQRGLLLRRRGCPIRHVKAVPVQLAEKAGGRDFSHGSRGFLETRLKKRKNYTLLSYYSSPITTFIVFETWCHCYYEHYLPLQLITHCCC